MKTAILVIYIAWGGYAPRNFEFNYTTMNECLEILAVTIIEIPQAAADSEWLAIATCKYK